MTQVELSLEIILSMVRLICMGTKSFPRLCIGVANFMEFEATTLSVLGKNIPISGGGYLRLIPVAT